MPAIFGIVGSTFLGVLDVLYDETSVTYIDVRHEQGAAFMANAWGRITGKAGVCLSTLGPGATNLVTGVADANLDKAPLVAITGQGGLSRLHHESHQYLDIVNMFKPITKWNTTVNSPEAIIEILNKPLLHTYLFPWSSFR